MGALSLLNLVILLLTSILSAAKIAGVPVDVLENLEAAIQKLLAVTGTDVTYNQLESLRVKTEW